MGDSQKARRSAFVGTEPVVDATSIRYRAALRAMQVDPVSDSESDEGEGSGSPPPKRYRFAGAPQTPCRLLPAVAVQPDTHVLPSMDAIPGLPFFFEEGAEEPPADTRNPVTVGRQRGQLLEAAVEALLAATRRWKRLRGRPAELQAAMDGCRRAVRAGRIRDGELVVEATEEDYAAVRASLAVLLKGMRDTGFEILAGRTWYRVGDEWQNIDGRVRRLGDQAVFLWDYCRRHSCDDLESAVSRKRELCFNRLMDLASAECAECPEELRSSCHCGFVVTHLDGDTIQHDTIANFMEDERDAQPNFM